MPASFYLYLRPRRPARMSKHVGRWLNGLLYHLVAASSPPLATRMHEEMSLKPFTVSLLEGRLVERDGLPWAVPEEQYRVRYTVLTDALYGALGQVLLERYLSRVPLDIGDRPFDLERVGVAPHEQSPWIGTHTYPELAEQATPSRQIALQFATPTAFKSGQLHLLFPQPWNVFGSLRRTWEAFSECPLPDELMSVVDEQMAVSRYELRSEVIRAGQYKLVGFTGTCSYLVRDKDVDEAVLRALNTLADFACYAGVGMKSTQGMGQTRRL